MARTKRTKPPKRFCNVQFHNVKAKDITVLDGVPFVVPVRARMPLVRRWWANRKKKAEASSRRLSVVYVFHYHIRMLYPKEKGILTAYPSSLVPLCEKEYYTSARYRGLARAVRARDDSRCRLCNRSTALEVHHRTYSYWGNEALEDLTTLCGGCHRAFHRAGGVADSKLLYVWTKIKPGRMLPLGYSESLAIAKRERGRIK